MAVEQETSAREAEAAGDSKAAEEAREFAAGFRTNGRSDIARATKASEAAREAGTRAEELEQQVKDHDETDTSGDKAMATEKAADQLEDKARWMDEAVRLERIAEGQRAEGKDDEAAATEVLVTDAWSKAEEIQPDLSGLDPAVLQEAGITPQPPIEIDIGRQEPGDDGGDTTISEATPPTEQELDPAAVNAAFPPGNYEDDDVYTPEVSDPYGAADPGDAVPEPEVAPYEGEDTWAPEETDPPLESSGTDQAYE